MAYADGTPAGRILAFVDTDYTSYTQTQRGFFGFFDCLQEQAIANALLETAAAWLKAEGMKSMCGPMNFSIGNECGVQLDAHDTVPYMQMNHTPPYYRSLVESAGLEKTQDLYAYLIRVEDIRDHPWMKKLEMLSGLIARKKNYHFRPVRMKNYYQELDHINTLFNQALTDNWGFVPSHMEEVLFTADALKMIIDPEIVFFVECRDQPVGCAISIPDINQVLIHLNGRLLPFGWIKFLYYKKKIDRIRFYLLGILPAHRSIGLDAVLYYQSILKAMQQGYREAELSWICEDNTRMIRIVEKLGAKRYKTYRMYEKPL